ncbi:Bug family tripartite tricarboxylate transporter substrate binding protein [Limnohabitans radicicola]|uniref:Tripartite tricarboxylate transporter substrate binding protein n=1 Tax=Limnohabitans radicicola TaxID=2771427 RepID=A0A927IN01_9BURK|nr:tripartite tricarboxylate transporter substrate-binding protein [Limnohabitans radicicola]MBD8051547.1 tripartite tricarboxylate transporter substrate binding protein [Limnohabitans radicicola]
MFSLPLHCILTALAGLLLTTSSPWANANEWPTHTLRLVVGFPAGSSPDLTARALAEPLGRALGQTVIVENKVGAGGNIAADAVAKATDGHTLGLMINGNMTVARILNPKLPYDPLKDLAPVSLIGTAPLLLAVPQSAPGQTPAQWLAEARQSGQQLSYGSPGVGTVAHLGMELLKTRTGLNPVHVPYPGNPQIINAMMGGQIQLALLPPAMALTQVRAGKLKAIGMTSTGRSTLAPDVPSLSESGVKNYQLEIWNAVAAPAAMPAAHIQKLSAAVSDIVRSPDMRQRLFTQGWQVVGSSPEGLKNRIEADTQSLGDIVRKQNIQIN